MRNSLPLSLLLSVLAVGCAHGTAGQRAYREMVSWPIAVEVSSLRWNALTSIAMDEGTLLLPSDRDIRERVVVRIYEDEAFVKEVTRRTKALKRAPGPPGTDFRLLALLIWGDGTTRRVAVPGSCKAMTRDGKAVECDRTLLDLLATKLSESHREALQNHCSH